MDQSNTHHDSDLPILHKKTGLPRIWKISWSAQMIKENSGLLPQHKVSAPANYTTLTPPTYLTILLVLARIFQQTGTSDISSFDLCIYAEL